MYVGMPAILPSRSPTRRFAMMGGMDIRPATPDDVEGIGRVHAVSRKAAYAGLVPDEALARITPASQAAHWAARLAGQQRPFAMYVAADGPRVEGFTLGSGDGEE